MVQYNLPDNFVQAFSNYAREIHINKIECALNRISDMMFDTLGSSLTGDSLRAICQIADDIRRIADALETK